MLEEFGPSHFRRIAIWDQDWNAIARSLNHAGRDLADPRSMGEKISHRLLAASQAHRASWPVRGFERFLRMSGW